MEYRKIGSLDVSLVGLGGNNFGTDFFGAKCDEAQSARIIHAAIDAGITFIDSSGLRVLLELAERVAAVGGRVALRNPSGTVSRIMEITGLESTFELG